MARQGKVSQPHSHLADDNKARHGKARQGKAWRGEAWLGKAWRGVARQRKEREFACSLKTGTIKMRNKQK